MKKLIKKFVILAVISALLGYKATKDIQQKAKAEYIKPTPTINAEETVESETVDLFFQEVDKEDDTETVNIENTEEVSEGLATAETIFTPVFEIEEKVKAEAQVTVQPTINNTVPSNTPKPTPSVTPTHQPVITPTPAATPVPTPVPTIAPTPVPQFDISYWTGFAQDYAKSIGLVLESSAVDCWDNPIPAGSHCNNIEQNITDRLNRYKNLEGFTDVWIWSEDLGNGSYDIYIGYA